jgi:hypothetical protein
MTFRDKRFWIVLLTSFVSIAAASDKDHEHLDIKPAATYPFKQTAEGITIAADVYETGDKVKAAFGKHNPYDYGVLPILVIIENHSAKAIRVDRLQAEYDTHSNGRVEATPPQELKYLRGASQPRANPAPLPIPGVGGIGRSKKNPLSDWEIEGRAFAAKIVPPGDTVSGFFYFQTGHRSNASLILQGIDEVGTGRELFYFEIPLAPVQ